MSNLKVNTINDASGGSAAVLYGVASPPNSMGFRNRIINGDMRIDQRNAGAAVTNSSSRTYAVDRFCIDGSVASKFTAQQVNVPSALAGFTKALKITSSAATSLGASDYYYLAQIIEGFNTADLAWGTASAQSVTLSFWVYSSLTGTLGGSVRNVAVTRSYPFSYAVNAANTWEYKTITIPGDTTGTWATDSTGSLNVALGLGVGSTFSGTAGTWAAGNFISATGATSVVGTSGATFYITGVQLEAGTVATPFERRDYGRELMMCQRYYEVVNSAAGTGGSILVYGANAWASWQFKVTKRAAPTIAGTTAGGISSGIEGARADGSTGTFGAFGYNGSGYGSVTASSEL